MSTKITTDQLKAIAKKYAVEYDALMAVITVESSGVGFNPPTGKMIIRFEPSWFKKLCKTAGQHLDEAWNGTAGNQAKEWQLFDSAFAIDPDKAMQATSVGMMQVMGFHFWELGFATVGAMWTYAKQSEENQVDLGMRFIKSEPALLNALKTKNWARFAYFYNGAKYKENDYDTKLLTAYNKFKNDQS
jgi:hypothetical protein